MNEQVTLDKPVTLTLSPATIVLVLTALHAGRYSEVKNALDEIDVQLKPHIEMARARAARAQAAADKIPPPANPTPNGPRKRR